MQLNISLLIRPAELITITCVSILKPTDHRLISLLFSLLGWDSPLWLLNCKVNYQRKEGQDSWYMEATGLQRLRGLRNGRWLQRCPPLRLDVSLARRQLPLAASSCLVPALTGTFFGPFQSAFKHSRQLSSAWAFSMALAGFPGISQVPAPTRHLLSPSVLTVPSSHHSIELPKKKKWNHSWQSL